MTGHPHPGWQQATTQAPPSPTTMYNQEFVWQAAVNEANRAILELMEHTGAPRDYILGGINRFFLQPRFFPSDVAAMPPQPPQNNTNTDLRRVIATAPPAFTIPPLQSQESDTERSTSSSIDMPLPGVPPMPHPYPPDVRYAPEPAVATTTTTKKSMAPLLHSSHYSAASMCTTSSPSKTEISGILKLMSVLVALGGAPVSTHKTASMTNVTCASWS